MPCPTAGTCPTSKRSRPSGRSSAGSSDLLSSVMARPTPFDLVFAHTAETVFPLVRAALEQGGHDPTDRDAFLMVPEVVSLLHDLRPEEGIGEGMDQLVALAHHAFLLWS